MRKSLIDKLRPYGQEHLLRFWDELDESSQGALAKQIAAIDFESVQKLFDGSDSETDWNALAARAKPPSALFLHEEGEKGSSGVSSGVSRKRGAAALAAGQVGAILVAGGQGTRLGFHHVKGMFPLGPVSGASLFQLHAESLLALGRRHGASIPLFVMTSPATHKETLDFFAQHNRFGLPEGDLFFFCQGTMPALDADSGKILLDEPGRLSASPDGHGGMVEALRTNGVLQRFQELGLRQLFYFQVDNVLAPICDAELIGHHLLAESELTTIAVRKQDPSERLGNIVTVEGAVQVIEYSDLPEEAANRRNRDGSLQLWAGSTAIHVFDAEFLVRQAIAEEGLPFHVARKKVPYLNEQGERVEPVDPNAVKFERFIFDLMPSARNALVVEGETHQVFAPLKNASGDPNDTPETARRLLIAQHRKWLESAGATVAPEVDVEISPLFALDARETAEWINPGTVVSKPRYFCDRAGR